MKISVEKWARAINQRSQKRRNKNDQGVYECVYNVENALPTLVKNSRLSQ